MTDSFFISHPALLSLFIMIPNAEEEPLVEDTDDELDWEEVDVPEQQHLDITIQTGRSTKEDAAVSKSVPFLI